MACKPSQPIHPECFEPSAGDGAFVRALLSNGVSENKITAVDIDQAAAKKLKMKYSAASIVKSDFIEYCLRADVGKFDVVVGNPPFIKRVAFGKSFADRSKHLSAATGFNVSQIKNAWAAFVIAAAHVLKPEGAIALVLPYELMTVKYGRAVQQFLVENGFSVKIFVSDDKVFPRLDQNAVILLAERRKGANVSVTLNCVKNCGKLTATRTANVGIMGGTGADIDMKSVFLDRQTVDLLHRLRTEMPTIRDYCGSAPGIVTAANAYFILSEDEVKKRDLKPWARSILKKGSYLPRSPVIDEADLAQIVKSEPGFLIDFLGKNAPPLSAAAKKYIEEGLENGIHKRYKCTKRTPWYRIPIIEAGDGLLFKRSHILPRLCVNRAGALATDTAYQVRMKEGFNIEDLCFSFYNSVTLLFAEIYGRFYGGGVLELTPEEFRGLPVIMLKPTKKEFDDFAANLFCPFKNGTENRYFCDRPISNALNLSEQDMSGIRAALTKLRAYRTGKPSRTGGWVESVGQKP